MFDTIAIVGVGLIGGSIGLAVRQRNIAHRVVGVGRSRDSLDIAQQRGAVTATSTQLDDAISDAELVVVCTPAATVAQLVQKIALIVDRSTIITDAASTKAGIVHALADDVRRGLLFVGSHPLAGDHRAGPWAARSELFDGSQVIVTPSPDTPDFTTGVVEQLWRSLGAVVRRMSAVEHDEMLAATSHLPHLVAACLAAATDERRMSLVGSGWRDTTRIAAGSVEVWRDIVLENRDNILQSLRLFDGVLQQLYVAIEQGDELAIIELLQRGKERRDCVGN